MKHIYVIALSLTLATGIFLFAQPTPIFAPLDTTVSGPLGAAANSIGAALLADQAKSELIATLQTANAMLVAQVAANQAAADSVKSISDACPECLGVVAAQVVGKRGLVISRICCGSTTVPPTYPDTVTILYIVDPSLRGQ